MESASRSIMAGGQAIDLASVGLQLSEAQLREMHRLKTGALLHASVLMGAACKEGVDAQAWQALSDYGQALGVAFVIVVVGGLGSFGGALVGGLFIGLVEALAGAYLGGEYKLLATFIVLVVVLMLRPYGLFGTHEIERL